MGEAANYDFGIIGNCTSAALVDEACAMVWLCLPYFDSPSVFASLLDKDKGGYFKICAKDLVSIKQTYVYHTAILKTTFTTKDGIFEVRDYMPRFPTEGSDDYCPSEIHRIIRLVEGTPKLYVEFKPRPNYGTSGVRLSYFDEYLKIASTQGEYCSFYLYSNLDLKAVAEGREIELKESAYFLLSYHEKLEPVSLEKIFVEYERTKSYWMYWVHRSRVPERHREMVLRSIITLKLLMYQRTGAVIAAPTTSLPEIIGGQRNWDYRYCWVRDASMIIDLYARLAHERSSSRYINFILNRMLLKNDNIAVMYGINGEKKLEERVLAHLDGYQGSKPVRIGNDAYRQKQNDMYGQLIETIYTYFVAHPYNSPLLDEEVWTVVRSLANRAIADWKEPDCGIWERRGELRHFVHSKLMSWVALDRAARIAKVVGKPHHAPGFLKVAEEIKADILKHGWDEQLQSFVMYYGGQDLDASCLLMLHYGFLDRKDPRMVNTVKAIYKDLADSGYVFRYKSPDEFGRPKNAFIVCTFWMINALYLIGLEQEALQMMEKITARANPLGLFSEGVEVATGRLTGNFPQGYSHLAFIQTVFLLETNYDWSDVSRSFV
ncbi:MAG: glycoside hydrolase family 15 protein [Candidatus Omnitrophica bacterium]|nr:glycoside hydrolase family 15 protein [Candidatus Omnitrophota bacterium]MDE2221611.1 glycoside hydrolase family 15 protein [Candidatus Omnitrophota bacterium]